jgi:antirestriction protein ArdC
LQRSAAQPQAKEATMTTNSIRTDLYTRVTSRIIADLEQGVRTWQRPWNAEHAAGCESACNTDPFGADFRVEI